MIAQNGQAELPLQPPAPKIMIMGTKGAGISTQIKKLCDKYKLDELSLKAAFTSKMKEEKEDNGVKESFSVESQSKSVESLEEIKESKESKESFEEIKDEKDQEEEQKKDI